ncbi:SPFH domain-containing protein [Streptomyces sp. NBC_00872]|uniref:slipin family protein n=1 Tax=Streptomyces sp. NBC_00872 TaxID=2903686 RepID=UPI003867060E|nr:SPFH domain-containing protein [Streptomyces sp. NBC_00872]
MVQELVVAVIAAICALGLYGISAARVIKQYERGVVLRLGQLREGVRGPGFTMIVPFVDRLHKVNMQIVTMPVPAQDGITRDNVTVRVDAVIYFKVVDAADAVIRVEDYRFAVSQMAQTSLRSIIGKSDLDDLLSNRERLNQGLELMIDSPAIGWGVQIDRVEIKDVSLPETMKRSMARQAEADRERRARVINADAELQASKKLAEAAKQMSEQPAALQLRLLQTVVAVAAEKNSTLVLPFPVELLRFLERATPAEAAQAVRAVSGAPVPSAVPSASGGARTEPRTSSEAAERSEASEALAPATPLGEAPVGEAPVGEAAMGEAAIDEDAIDEAPPPRAAPRQKPVPTQPRV